jgi:PAS domain S-box-containing protein
MDGALLALQRDEVDMVMSTQRRLMFVTHFLELPGYKTNIVFDQPIQTISGVNKNEEALCFIIDKALKVIDTKGISDRWMRKTYDYRIKVAEARYPLLVGASILSLIILALILALLYRSRGEGRRLEKVVAEKTSTLTAILDATPDIIFCKDLASRYTECNKALENHFNCKRTDIIGKNDTEAFGMPVDVAAQYMAMNERIFSEKKLIIVEEIIPSFDGKQQLFETKKMPLMMDGKVVGLVIMARDITLRKAMEEEAKSASEAKSRFIATMSHELRTPMNSIIGFSELAMNDRLPAETKDYLNKIMINSEWLLQIINDILDISKIESGKMELERIPFNLHELFIACRTMIAPKAEEKGVTLYFYTEPSIGKKMLGDPLRLRQVLLNLLSNAVKFTNKGGLVKIAATVKGDHRPVSDTIAIDFEVKDSGIGMTVEQISKLSQPFMQADTATTRKYGGTGLGLAISRNIVEMMGSKLNVESTPGVGSKFSFEIIFDTIELEEAALESTFIDSPANRPQFTGEILICEDNQMNQQVLYEHLERVGIKADVAENGREGFNMVKRRHSKNEKPYNLIFMDIHMPIMDGIEASALINELNTGTPIVAMTANVMSHEKDLYRKYGMKDCVGKPFRVQELWNCLLKYFTPVKWNTENEAENRQYNEKLKFTLMVNFIKDNQTRYSEITNAINSGDIKLANRLAHTMKSNAGQLGKTKLQKAAEELEHLLKDGKSLVTAEHLAVLEAELTAVLDELAPLVKENAPPPPPQAEPIDAEAARVALAELKPLLERGNPDCLKYIDKLRGIQGTNEPLVQKLIQQMEDLDFEPALETLASIIILP